MKGAVSTSSLAIASAHFLLLGHVLCEAQLGTVKSSSECRVSEGLSALLNLQSYMQLLPGSTHSQFGDMTKVPNWAASADALKDQYFPSARSRIVCRKL